MLPFLPAFPAAWVPSGAQSLTPGTLIQHALSPGVGARRRALMPPFPPVTSVTLLVTTDGISSSKAGPLKRYLGSMVSWTVGLALVRLPHD